MHYKTKTHPFCFNCAQHETQFRHSLNLKEFLKSYFHAVMRPCLWAGLASLAVIQHSHFVGFPDHTHTKYVQ